MPKFTSGKPGTRSDCSVTFIPENPEHVITVRSKVDSMYGKGIENLARSVCKDLKVQSGRLIIDDHGALPFVIQARIEAVVKMADPGLQLRSLPEQKKHFYYSSKKDRFRRSRLYLPGNQPKLMLNAGIHKPDAIILDLEDSVASAEKMSARFIVRNALRVLDFFKAEKMVRINQGEIGILDLEEVIPENVHLILIPKAESAGQIIHLEKVIHQICKSSDRSEPVYLMPILESAKGILNAFQIAASSRNIVALAIGLEDYTADIGTSRTVGGAESFFARSMIVNAAKAFGIQAIDTVFSDVRNTAGLTASVKEAKSLGFDGKGCIHPRQIKPIHLAFAPTRDEIDKAKNIVIAFDEAEANGLGVVSLGSKMIDPPVVKRALHTIEMAVSTGLINRDWKSDFH